MHQEALLHDNKVL